MHKLSKAAFGKKEIKWKVINNKSVGKLEKKELYTELYTLSTKKWIILKVYIVKKRTGVLYRNDKVDNFAKKRVDSIDISNVKN